MENHHLGIFFQAPRIRKSKFRSEVLEDVIFSDLNKYAQQWPNEKLVARVEFFPGLLQLQNGIQWKKWIAVELNCRWLQYLGLTMFVEVAVSGCPWAIS